MIMFEEDSGEKFVRDSIELYENKIAENNLKLKNPALTFEEREKLHKEKQEYLTRLQSFKSMKIKSEDE